MTSHDEPVLAHRLAGIVPGVLREVRPAGTPVTHRKVPGKAAKIPLRLQVAALCDWALRHALHLLMVLALAGMVSTLATEGNFRMHEVPLPAMAPAPGTYFSAHDPHAIQEIMAARKKAAYWAGVHRYVVAMCHDGRWHRTHITLCNQVMSP